MTFRLSYKRYQLPLSVPLRTAHGWWREREGLLVRAQRADGKVGFGEVAPIPWFGTETVAQAEEFLRGLPTEVSEAQLTDVPEELRCLRFGLEQARTVEPEAAPAGKRLPVVALLPAGRAALEVLRARLEEGYLAFKWKVGVEKPAEELGILEDLLAALPGYAKLRLDANGAWARPDAEKWLTRCAERPVEFVEQPVAPANEDLLWGLAQDFPVTLGLDESVTGEPEARRWQEAGWPGVFVLKPALFGPLSVLDAWLEKAKPDVVFSSAIETAVARAGILRWVLQKERSSRALGFGIGALFGRRDADGPTQGPLLDASWGEAVKSEELWNALT